MNENKHFFYDSGGEIEQSPSNITCTVSERPLAVSEELKKTQHSLTPNDIGLGIELIPGKKENIVLQGPFDLEGSEVLDINEYPVPTEYDDELLKNDVRKLSETLKYPSSDNTPIGVIRWNGFIIWFDKQYACIKSDFLSRNSDFSQNSEEEKLYSYDIDGNLQEEGPDDYTIALSEEPLEKLGYELEESPFDIGLTNPVKDLVIGSTVDLILEENLDLSQSEVLDINEYPLLEDTRNKVGIGDDNLNVVEKNGSLVWFDNDFVCYLADTRKKEPAVEENEKPFYKRLWFWSWLLFVIGIMFYAYFVNN